jgi:dihydrodipicolinate synthase/N-acetylneuraminate lyase
MRMRMRTQVRCADVALRAACSFGSQIAVIGNTGSNATREAARATCQGFAVGMDAALHINPYYGKTSRDGLIYHFQASCLLSSLGLS